MFDNDVLVTLIKVASNNSYLAKLHESISINDNSLEPIDQIKLIYKFGHNLEPIVHEDFNPWIYVSNYPETLHQFWDNYTNSLNEIFTTYVYICFGWINNIPRNFSGISLYSSYTLLKPKVLIHFTGSLHDSIFDQFLASTSHVDFLLNNLFLHYPYFSIFFDNIIILHKDFSNLHDNIYNKINYSIWNGSKPKFFKSYIALPINKVIDNNFIFF